MKSPFRPSLLLPEVVSVGLAEGDAAYENKDYTTALYKFKPLASQGNASAQYRLGIMYANGQGVAQDAIEAVMWYRLAAEQGDSRAQHNLGVMYDKGHGCACRRHFDQGCRFLLSKDMWSASDKNSGLS